MIPIPVAEGKGAPNLLPATLVLGMLLWIFTTTGGQQILVNEMLSEAYDSQAEHFLRGDVGVDVDAIRHEAMIVDGKARMYFGPFPAFVRIPLNFVYPSGTRTLVAHHRLLRGNDFGRSIRRTYSVGVAALSIVGSLEKSAWKCVLDWIRARFAPSAAAREPFDL